MAALARMLTFARTSASDLKLDLPVYCLDMALTAVLAEAEKTPEVAAAMERLELPASQMH
nr:MULTISPECIES: hypothetical protein [unclassified Ciceribacter]